jgi:transcriptional regulator with XRE-family HTH domain
MKKEKINVIIGNRIRTLREKNGFNQYDFAYECEVSDAYYGRIERGEHSPSMITLYKITKTLGISLSDFFAEIEKEILGIKY